MAPDIFLHSELAFPKSLPQLQKLFPDDMDFPMRRWGWIIQDVQDFLAFMGVTIPERNCTLLGLTATLRYPIFRPWNQGFLPRLGFRG